MVGQRRDEPQLPADLALLLNAIRSEFDAKLAAQWWRYLTVGGLGGVVGSLAAELVRPGSTQAALALLPFV